MVRWIFANQRPNHDFAIAFDEDVIKVYEEFDRFEQQALAEQAAKPEQQHLQRRIYALSSLDGSLPAVAPKRASFRLLSARLQFCGGDAQRTYERYYQQELQSPADRQRFFIRVERALLWLDKYAPDEFRYRLQERSSLSSISAAQAAVITNLRGLVERVDIAAISSKELNELLWAEVVKTSELTPAEVFATIYQRLIGRDQGPKLPAFMQEIGGSKILEIL
jgi:lysyl-tRNA synthetase class 1